MFHMTPFASGLALLGVAVGLFATAAHADDALTIDAAVGLPRARVIDGTLRAWRTLAVRAETDWISVDAKAPVCLSTPAGIGGADTGVPACVDGMSASSSRHVQAASVGAMFKLPSFGPGLPLLDLGFRSWGSGNRADPAGARNGGSSLEAQLLSVVGIHELTAGVSVPLTRPASGGAWSSAFVSWIARPAARVSLEATIDTARELGTGQHERTAFARIRFDLSGNARLSTTFARTLTPTDDPWFWSVGFEWKF